MANYLHKRSTALVEKEIICFIRQTPAKIKFYHYLESNLQKAISISRPPNNAKKTSTVENYGKMLAEVSRDIKIVEEAFNIIPSEYKDAIKRHFYQGENLTSERANDAASKNTLYKYRKIFLLEVGKGMGVHEEYIEFLKDTSKKK